MKYAYANEVNKIIGSETESADITKTLVDKFYSNLIKPSDKTLIDFAFSERVEQSDVDEFIKNWDIEEAGGTKALLLSYMIKEQPHIKFSQYEAPRLEGLFNFYRFRNLQTIAHYTKIGKKLNENNIFPMILKGGAMKYLRPELPRVMEDIDILVSSDAEFSKACEIAENLGYEFELDATEHSVDLHSKGSLAGTVDVHRYIYMEADYDKSFMKTLFSRATKTKVFGVDSFVPCYEDMVFVGMINLARNLHRNTSIKGVLYTLFDIKFLKEKPNFNWDIVVENTLKTNTSMQMYLVVDFVNKIVPGLLPENLLQNKQIEKDVARYCDRVMFYRFYVHDVKMICKKLKLKDALKSFSVMKEYIKAKPKHFVLKRINKNYKLIKTFLKFVNIREKKVV